MKSNYLWRIRILSGLILFLAVFFLSRLFFIQVVKAEKYQDEADRQYLSPSGNIFDRGSIYSVTKDGKIISLASIKFEFTVAINPEQIKDKEETYQKLNSVFDFNKESFMKSASKKKTYEEIATKLDQETADKIKALKLRGVFVIKQKARFYPAGKMASHLVGLLGFQGDDYAGRYGLEKQYEKILSRKEELSFANFFVEAFSGLGKTITQTKDESAGDITTSIEPVVQKFFEEQLLQTKDHWQADGFGGIIMDPQTGEILAMTAWPNFHPGEKVTNLAVLPNPLVESVYEMGSIIKPITMASGLDSGVIKTSTTYNDKGCMVLDKKKICNYDLKARGVVPMQEVLSQSLNLGVAFIAEQLGRERFHDYFYNFGLAEKTGVDLPGEVNGNLKNLDNKRHVEYATASFGQGIALTPIATVRALAVLGNGGYLVTPHVVKKIDYVNKITRTIEPAKGKRVIKPETSEEVSRMLVEVVDTKMKDKVGLPHYSIAAKTGTAQMFNPQGGGYYTDRNLHSFFGYFPAYKPRFIVFMYLIYPKEVRYSSETLSEPFSNTTKFLLNYYQIPPDR